MLCMGCYLDCREIIQEDVVIVDDHTPGTKERLILDTWDIAIERLIRTVLRVCTIVLSVPIALHNRPLMLNKVVTVNLGRSNLWDNFITSI